MKASALSSRIRTGTLLMLAFALLAGVLALPKVYSLGGAIRTTLYRNYVSIEDAQQMHAALNAVQLAQRDGKLKTFLAPNREKFTHWLDVELSDITEVGETELATDIEHRGQRLFEELARDPGERRDLEFEELD